MRKFPGKAIARHGIGVAITAIGMAGAVAGASSLSQASDRPGATISDARDGHSYRIVRIGGLDWFAQNLDHATPDSRCYDDSAQACAELGRLYRIHDALRACPAGWRLPSEYDWQDLELAIGIPRRDLGKAKAARGMTLDRRLMPGGDTGFDAQLGGWYDVHVGGKYMARDRNAAYWASTKPRLHVAWHRDLAPHRGGVWRSVVDDSYWISVRCVRG